MQDRLLPGELKTVCHEDRRVQQGSDVELDE